MNLPDFISQLQAHRLRGIRAALDAQLSQAGAARSMGIHPTHLAYCVKQFTGSGRWPADPALIDALLALPVLDEREVRERRGKSGAETLTLRRIDEFEIAARREQVARSRAAHERHWLDLEQAKYGLPRPGRPLSSMIA